MLNSGPSFDDEVWAWSSCAQTSKSIGVFKRRSVTRRTKMKKFIFALMLAAVWGGQVSAQSSQESLKEYVPVLPVVKAKFWKIDPKLRYAVKNVGGGVYVISDHARQSAFLVTDEGVIVFDSPASFGKS